MKKNRMLMLAAMGLGIMIFSTILFGGPVQGTNEENPTGRVVLPWNDFQTLLQLDRDEIVLSSKELTAILNQIAVDQRPDISPVEGRMVLTREQFRSLLQRMRPQGPSTGIPPAPYLIQSAEYTMEWGEDQVDVRAVFTIQTFESTSSGYSKVPLFPEAMAIRSMATGKEKVTIMFEQGRIVAVLPSPAQLTLVADFVVGLPAKQHSHQISFPIPQTPITRVSMKVDSKEADIQIDRAASIQMESRGKITVAQAILAPGTAMNVTWRKKIPQIERGPAKLYAETNHLITLEDGSIRVTAYMRLTILQNLLSAVRIRLPEGYTLLNLTGDSLGDWILVDKDEIHMVEVPFLDPREGQVDLVLSLEHTLEGEASTVSWDGCRVIDAVRDAGTIGVESKATSECTILEENNVHRVDPSELPVVLQNASRHPFLYACSYLSHPSSFLMEISRHPELPVISTVVDSIHGVTLLTPDGKCVHQATYTVRNTSRQFMTFVLPEKTEVWSVFVSGEPVKPRLSEGSVLVPLKRSRPVNGSLDSFTIELVLFERFPALSALSRGRVSIPVPDAIVSQVMWSLVVPEERSFLALGGTMEQEKQHEGLRPLLSSLCVEKAPLGMMDEDKALDVAGREQEADKLKDQFSPSLALPKEEIARQVEEESRFGERLRASSSAAVGGTAGVLPIRIHIPTHGQVFRFAKTVIYGDSLTITFTQASTGLLSVLRTLLWLLLMAGSLRLVYVSLKRMITGKICVRDMSILGLALLAILSIPVWLPASLVFLAAGWSVHVAWKPMNSEESPVGK